MYPRLPVWRLNACCISAINPPGLSPLRQYSMEHDIEPMSFVAAMMLIVQTNHIPCASQVATNTVLEMCAVILCVAGR